MELKKQQFKKVCLIQDEMAWYGNHVDTAKKLDQLIDQNPNLNQLLSFPDFIPQLKAYNPKLLEFLTNSNTIIADLINYVSIPPQDNDSDDRKYRLPALTIQMIESEAQSVINGFFKEDPKRKTKFLNTMFQQQFSNSNKIDGQVLPMLAGYFLRVNICLLNNKYRQTIDCMYENPRNFELLLDNCHSLSVTNTLQVYLNLDLTKNSQTPSQLLNIKINTINRIMKMIDESVEAEKMAKSDNNTYFNVVRVQNLSSVLIELLEKYYLIADGKQMVDQILYQDNNVKSLFKNIDNKNSEISMSLLNILISVVKYYSLSSFNSEEWSNPQIRKKNEEKLQSQPAIILLSQNLPQIISQLSKCKNFSIYQAKLVELINSTIMLNSHKIFNCVKNYKYFEILFDLMFRFEHCSIFSMMIEKLFIFIFRTQRLLNEEIKHYIFCEAKVIDITAGRYLTTFQNDEQIAASMGASYRRKGFFGHLMKIMKIYSGIQTTDDDIINSIKNKSDIWNKISRLILKPYEVISIKELSTYENIPEMTPNEFSVKTIIGSNTNLSMAKQGDNTKLIDQINRQQAIQNLKTLQSSIQQNKIEAQNITSSHKESHLVSKDSSDGFFEAPTSGRSSITTLETKDLQSLKADSQNETNLGQNTFGSPVLEKKANSYNDFLERQKVKAETQIRKERSRSKQKALSKGKTRITSPSPTKRVNKWQNSDDKTEVKEVAKQKVSLTGSRPATDTPRGPLPKIPMQKKGINLSSNSTDQSKQENLNKSLDMDKKQIAQNDFVQNRSMPNLQALKSVKIIYRFDPPAKRQYRKINEEDRAILDSLGIAYT